MSMFYFKVDCEAYLFGCYDFQRLRPTVIYSDDWLRRETYSHYTVSYFLCFSQCIHMMKCISVCGCLYVGAHGHSSYVYVIHTYTHRRIRTQTRGRGRKHTNRDGGRTHACSRAHTHAHARAHTLGARVLVFIGLQMQFTLPHK